MTITNEILAASGIQFGTSGARGLVEQFTDDACAAFTTAFVRVMQQRFTVDRIALGIDRRPSSPAMAAACAAAAKTLGLSVDYYGVLPTPALALQAMQDGIPAIMITGSHIPFDRNGIKFYRPDGEIDKADEVAIVTASLTLAPMVAESLASSSRARENYIARYLTLFPQQMLAGKRIGLYEHSAAGRDINAEVLAALGAEVVSLGRTETFVPIDTEAVSEQDCAQALIWSIEHNLDAIFSTDGDGDRPLLADEKGHWLRGDMLGLLCARELGIEALAIPVSCNSAIDKTGAFKRVERTRIGSPYVIAGMSQLAENFAPVAGFEANGGFLLQSPVDYLAGTIHPLPTRDALLPALIVLSACACKQCPISELVSELPRRFTASDRIQNMPTQRSLALIAKWSNDHGQLLSQLMLQGDITTVDTTDGLRVTLSSGDVVHLRPSGNAPELRCYTESTDEEAAKQLVSHCLERISTLG